MDYLNTREIQDVLLDMLIQLDQVLTNHDIRYTLDGGTLLGAIRHKGFIPWDDDVDLLVPRPDFNRLISHPEWVPDGYRLASQGVDGYELPFAKFFNLSWRAQEPIFEGELTEYLWVDLFPADPVPESDEERARLAEQQQKTSIKASRLVKNIDFAAMTATNPVKGAAKRVLFPIYRKMYSSKDAYALLTERALQIPYGTTKELGDLVWGPFTTHFPGVPKEDFDNLINVDFEGHLFKACPHWDEYLSGLYGDYMTLPPVEQRMTHGIKVWHV